MLKSRNVPAVVMVVSGALFLLAAFFVGMAVGATPEAPPALVDYVEAYKDGFQDGACQQNTDLTTDGFGNYCETSEGFTGE